MKIRWSACKLADDIAGRSGSEALGAPDWRASSQLLHINVQRFRGGLVLKAHRLCVSPASLRMTLPPVEAAKVAVYSTGASVSPAR